MTDGERDERTEVLRDIEAERETTANPELEADLSINDWVARVQGAAKEAHRNARLGETNLEYQAWIEMAAIAAGRAEQVLAVIPE